MNLCIVEGCSNPVRVKSRGLCNKHYRRWQRYGDPEYSVRQYFTNPEEAWEHHTLWQGECLVWTGSKTKSGYGQITYKGKNEYAHRYAWIRVYGDLEPGVHIDHKECYNPTCVNVEHLREASNIQNSWNKSKTNVNNSSGHRNVCWQKGKWVVMIQKEGKTHYFGRYSDIEEAARVAEEKRKLLFGEFAGRG